MKNNVKIFFDQDAIGYNKEWYDSNIRTFISTRQKVLEEMIEKHLSSKNILVLDAGCGPGFFIKTVVENGFRAVGIDISGKMLNISKKKIKKLNKLEYANFLKCDVENIPFQPETFDVVNSAGVIEYLNDEKIYIKQLNTVLKKQGILMIAITNKFSYLSLFDYVFESLKKNKMMRSAFNVFKKHVFKRGDLKNITFKIHKQSPPEFKKLLTKSGFEIIQEKYFYYFPSIVKKGTMGSVIKNLQISSEKLSNTKLKFLGEGCLFICYKN